MKLNVSNSNRQKPANRLFTGVKDIERLARIPAEVNSIPLINDTGVTEMMNAARNQPSLNLTVEWRK